MNGFLSGQRLALQLASRHLREGYSGSFKYHTPLIKQNKQVLREYFLKRTYVVFNSFVGIQLDSNWSSEYYEHRHC